MERDLEKLGQDLATGDVEARRRAVRELAEEGSEDALRLLLRAAEDRDPRVRHAAVGALACCDRQGARDALHAALHDHDPWVRNHAAEVLTFPPGRVVGLGSRWPFRRLRAVQHVARQDSLPARRCLLRALEDWFLPVRRASARALAVSPRPSEVDAWMAALRDWAVRDIAAAVLADLGEPAAARLCELLADAHGKRVKLASGLLQRIGPPAVPPLLATLVHPRSDPAGIAPGILRALGADHLAQAVLEALDGMPAKAVECSDHRVVRPLVLALNSYGRQPEHAARTLLLMGSRALGPLAEALRAGPPPLQREAAGLLARSGEQGVELLVRALGYEQESACADARAALVGLGAGAAPAVRAAVASQDPKVRKGAVLLLGELGDRTSQELLVGAAHSEDPGTRWAAIEALAKVGDAAAANAFIAALEDPSVAVRRSAVSALARFPDGCDVRALTQVLMQALADSDPQVRWTAAEALATAPDRSAIPALARLLSDRSRQVRDAAATALATFGGEALPVLLPLLQSADTETRYGVCLALGKMGSPAVSQLIGMLDDPSLEVANMAVHALGDIGAPAGPALPKIWEQLRLHGDWGARTAWRWAAWQIEQALRSAPAELEAAAAPLGTGTELEAGIAPAGTGTELQAGEAADGVEPVSST